MTNSLSEVMTVKEAEDNWGLKPGTVRRACRENRIVSRKSAGTWLTTASEMNKVYGSVKIRVAIDDRNIVKD